ncbi:hypothetical protein [Spartinivicinus ruber]|uniref:hypothetical protein n=1 Tax=Spartinivicinus ruber TaxID=2683272 RepID=UPI0013D329F5|nr:hypothetical protein [Spartinivicinus ruber]
MSESIEIFRFKLNTGASQADLETANQNLQLFIQQQPGFLYRSLSFNHITEEWIGINYWQSETAAKAAAEKFTDSSLTQAYMALIDKKTLTKEQSTVVACQPGNCGNS